VWGKAVVALTADRHAAHCGLSRHFNTPPHPFDQAASAVVVVVVVDVPPFVVSVVVVATAAAAAAAAVVVVVVVVVVLVAVVEAVVVVVVVVALAPYAIADTVPVIMAGVSSIMLVAALALRVRVGCDAPISKKHVPRSTDSMITDGQPRHATLQHRGGDAANE
jgi:hypothetical protein